MRCAFTRGAIAGALASGGVAPVIVVLPRGPKPLGTGWPEPPFDRWLRERGVEIIEVHRLAGDDLDAVMMAIRERDVALGVGACFPWKVPASLRAAVPGGMLNIHPSLLPALRGPEPVFHAFRLGLAETGVTVHRMDDGWDNGPVVAQESVPIPDTGTADAFEATLAGIGGRLLGELAAAWMAGTARATPQDDSLASWAPSPAARDRIIPTDLTVAEATRFLRACGPLLAWAPDGALVEVGAVADDPPRDAGDLRNDRRLVAVPCRDGTLWALR
jgi:methionyl-tRNA formyltransferase